MYLLTGYSIAWGRFSPNSTLGGKLIFENSQWRILATIKVLSVLWFIGLWANSPINSDGSSSCHKFTQAISGVQRCRCDRNTVRFKPNFCRYAIDGLLIKRLYFQSLLVALLLEIRDMEVYEYYLRYKTALSFSIQPFDCRNSSDILWCCAGVNTSK